MLDLPGNSPELGLIKHLWYEMKAKLADQHPTSIESLTTAKQFGGLKNLA